MHLFMSEFLELKKVKSKNSISFILMSIKLNNTNDVSNTKRDVRHIEKVLKRKRKSVYCWHRVIRRVLKRFSTTKVGLKTVQLVNLSFLLN